MVALESGSTVKKNRATGHSRELSRRISTVVLYSHGFHHLSLISITDWPSFVLQQSQIQACPRSIDLYSGNLRERQPQSPALGPIVFGGKSEDSVPSIWVFQIVLDSKAMVSSLKLPHRFPDQMKAPSCLLKLSRPSRNSSRTVDKGPVVRANTPHQTTHGPHWCLTGELELHAGMPHPMPPSPPCPTQAMQCQASNKGKEPLETTTFDVPPTTNDERRVRCCLDPVAWKVSIRLQKSNKVSRTPRLRRFKATK